MLAIITLFDQFSQVISESISHASRSGVIRLFITRTHLTRYKQKRPYVAFLILSKRFRCFWQCICDTLLCKYKNIITSRQRALDFCNFMSMKYHASPLTSQLKDIALVLV